MGVESFWGALGADFGPFGTKLKNIVPKSCHTRAEHLGETSGNLVGKVLARKISNYVTKLGLEIKKITIYVPKLGLS